MNIPLMFRRNAVAALSAIVLGSQMISGCGALKTDNEKGFNQSGNAQNADYYLDTGMEKGKSGDLQGAIADFSKAIQVNPQHARAYYNRAHAKELNNDLNGAIADYNKAVEIDPQYALAYHNRGIIKFFSLDDRQGACADWRMANSLGMEIRITPLDNTEQDLCRQ